MFRGQTPLTLAISLGHLQCVQVLLEADPSAVLVKNAQGWSPIHEAISLGNRDILKMVYLAKRKEQAAWVDAKGKQLLQDISRDLQDIVFEMNWSFHSFIPFVSSLCPSDTYCVYKKGSMVRIDTTLVGYENLNWIRGNISIIFRGQGPGLSVLLTADPKLVILDRDTKKIQQIWPKDFTIDDAALEEDISVLLNTPIHATPDLHWKEASLTRAKSGFFAFKYDKNEVIEGFPTRVWNLDSVKMAFPVRKEHLSAHPLPQYVLDEQEAVRREKEAKKKEKEKERLKAAPPSRFVITNPDTDSDSEVENLTYSAQELEIEEKIKNYKPGYRNIEDGPDDEWAEARKIAQSYTAFRPTLNPPPKPAMSVQDFVSTDTSVHLGRPLEITQDERVFRATLWMYEPKGHETDLDTLPLHPSKLAPLMQMLGMGNEHIRSFNAFLSQGLPDGFPVQVDIPIGMLPLSARIRFQNIVKACDRDDSWFYIPGEQDGYRFGEIITSTDQ
ncbi:hypothetical protein HDV03_000782 [Kappamyces sp. JEL0829]|nr:hypothetical protein HDV03_000782 [Kappamyces sp. JEL0829]